MADRDMALMAHLLRRAGFGATREELEAYVAKGYEATVEELLHPEDFEPVDELFLLRYHPAVLTAAGAGYPMGHIKWLYHMMNTRCPLEEKMAVLWHQVFATSNSKVDNGNWMQKQIMTFRHYGMGNFQELLIELAKDSAMIYWLDNNTNTKWSVNENWGRELLELFSMGVGNYTEVDVREVSRAFTGWNLEPTFPRFPYHRFESRFEYRPEDHDNADKEFLGYKGKFNGEDVIDIIVQHPSCPRFVARHLYNFFVADEVQVPSWHDKPPRDSKAIDILADSFAQNNYEIRPVLRRLFNSDFFKSEDARFAKVKSPAELMVQVYKLVGGFEFPRPGYGEIALQTAYMGQDILYPPSVEGWHTGHEWINSGSLLARVNFTAALVGDTQRPGVGDLIQRLKARGTLSPEEMVATLLDLLGSYRVSASTEEQLLEHARKDGALRWDSKGVEENSTRRTGEMLQMIVATREYQFA